MYENHEIAYISNLSSSIMDSVTLVHILWIFVSISFLPFLINNLYPSPNLSNLWTLPDRSRQDRSSCTNQWKLKMSNHWPITVSERDKVDSWTGVIWVVINTFRINKIYLLDICLNKNKIHINIYNGRHDGCCLGYLCSLYKVDSNHYGGLCTIFLRNKVCHTGDLGSKLDTLDDIETEKNWPYPQIASLLLKRPKLKDL